MRDLKTIIGGECLYCGITPTRAQIDAGQAVRLYDGTDDTHAFKCEDCIDLLGDLDETDAALTLAATGFADECAGSTDLYGRVERVGRVVILMDGMGNNLFDTCQTETAAAERFDRYYLEGYGADESDAFIHDHAFGGYTLQWDGKHIDTYPRLTRARAAARMLSNEQGYYPSLWLVGERGNLSLLDY